MVPYLIAIPGAIAVIFLIRRYCAGTPCTCDARLDGKTVIVTGSNSGIGKEAALEFAKRGSRVIVACRDPKKGEQTVADIKRETGNGNVHHVQLDLTSFKSINLFAEQVKSKNSQLDVLVNNAGVFFVPFSLTADGWETVFQVNYLGHFLLTLLLLDLMKAAPSSRIVNVASKGHKMCKKLNLEDINGKPQEYKKLRAYSQSKVAQVLFTRTLSKKLSNTRITVNAVDPGNVDTPLFRTFPLLWNNVLRILQWPVRAVTFKSPREGAQTTIHCVLAPELAGVSGQYFSDCAVAEPSKLAKDDVLADKLWHFSLEAVGEKNVAGF